MKLENILNMVDTFKDEIAEEIENTVKLIETKADEGNEKAQKIVESGQVRELATQSVMRAIKA